MNKMKVTTTRPPNKNFPNATLKKKDSHAEAISNSTHSQQRAPPMNFLPLLKEEEGKNKKKKKKQQLQQNKYITNTKRGTITTTTITRCPHFSPFNPTNPFIFSPADSVFKDEDLEPLSATTLISSWGTDCGYDEYSSDTDRAWSMRSFLPILPDSPSPLCTPTSPSPSYSSPYSSRSLTSTQTNKVNG